ncbi:hypothetical protein RRF57_000687 [Xylaria bambusicola]|uniref:Uncharacterized protein n=1 Tax=Xylaria bambusicola TaxID=326684 RepID=A0AAN7UEZ1_9PEZI
MAPTPQEIKSILEGSISQDLSAKVSSGKVNQPALLQHFNSNVDVHVNGQGFQHATQLKGVETVKAAVAPGGSHADVWDAVDHSKPYDAQVLQVIGGGSQSDWAAAVVKATGTAANGESLAPASNEIVKVLTLRQVSHLTTNGLSPYSSTTMARLLI